MKITISKEQIVKGLQSVQGVVSESSHMPIIANVMIEASGTSLKLTATDLDISIACSVEAKVFTEGSTTVSARKMFGIVREMVGSEIEIESDEKSVCSVRSGNSFYRINGLSTEEFPPIGKLEKPKTFKIDQSAWKQLMQRTSFAMSAEANRYVLCSMMVVIGEESITTVTADGRRLAIASVDVESKGKSCGQLIVPSGSVNELLRLTQADGEVEISYTETAATFAFKNKDAPITLWTKLVDGAYPNYKQIIPKESKEKVRVPRSELIGALKRAEIMTNEKMSSVKFAFTKNNLIISANSPGVGDASESIAVKYKGEEIAIAFNPKYILDALSNLADDEVIFEMMDGISPLVVKIDGPFVYVVSPMRQA